MLLLLLACPDPTGPAATGSRSADLALRAGEVGRRADALAESTRNLEGLFDRLRAAPAVEQEGARSEIRARALEIQTEAHALQDEVGAIEAGARAY